MFLVNCIVQKVLSWITAVALKSFQSAISKMTIVCTEGLIIFRFEMA